jgi:hypothetical protein
MRLTKHCRGALLIFTTMAMLVVATLPAFAAPKPKDQKNCNTVPFKASQVGSTALTFPNSCTDYPDRNLLGSWHFVITNVTGSCPAAITAGFAPLASQCNDESKVTLVGSAAFKDSGGTCHYYVYGHEGDALCGATVNGTGQCVAVSQFQLSHAACAIKTEALLTKTSGANIPDPSACDPSLNVLGQFGDNLPAGACPVIADDTGPTFDPTMTSDDEPFGSKDKLYTNLPTGAYVTVQSFADDLCTVPLAFKDTFQIGVIDGNHPVANVSKEWFPVKDTTLGDTERAFMTCLTDSAGNIIRRTDGQPALCGACEFWPVEQTTDGGGGKCGTAFGKARTPDPALCFLDDNDSNGSGDFDRWGWTNGLLGQGIHTFDLYVGAAQCDTTKGELAGTVTVNYSGTTMTVTYTITQAGDVLTSTHVYVGGALYPVFNGKATVAPGKYNYVHSSPDTPTSDTFTITGLDGNPKYVIAHAGVTNSDGCTATEPQ